MDVTEESDRWTREREFHNLRFEDDSERELRVGKFYSAIDYGFAYYRERVLQESKDRRLLEYGCGNASLGFDVAPIAEEVIGIDISDVAIEQAQRIAAAKQLANVRFVVDNAESMRQADKSVDVLAGSGIVHHLDIPRAMREVRRVLKDGGLAIFAEPLGHNPAVNWYRNRTPEIRTADEHPLLARDLKLMAQGFRKCKVTYFGFIAPVLGFLSPKTNPKSPLTKFVWGLDKLTCRIPGLKRYAWFCIIELRA
jgi:ubiquinone/menaquinone biosynthesis C-methylase UbiE